MHKIVLTGGPCSGKTTGLNVIAEWLRNNNFAVLTVPEVATEILNAGVHIHMNDVPWVVFQEHLMKLQMKREDVYTSLLSSFRQHDKVLLCDRGALDCRAYMSDDEFSDVLKRLNMSISDLFGRYDSAHHLVTAADGAEAFYTRKNNPMRLEDNAEARKTDRRTQEAWLGHNHPLQIIDNSTDFEHKMKRLWTGVCRVVGIPEPIEEERRFLIKRPNFEERDNDTSTVVPVGIEQIYLKRFASGVEWRIRKRVQGGGAVYYMTQKRSIDSNRKRAETEERIQKADYDLWIQTCDPKFNIIRKVRHCFIWNYQYFEVDIFSSPHSGLCIMEVEITEENQEVLIPGWITVIKEITGDECYSNRELARKGGKLPVL